MTNLNMTTASPLLSPRDATAWTMAYDLAQKLITLQKQALCAGLSLDDLNLCLEASSRILGLECDAPRGRVARALLALESHLADQGWTSSALRDSCLLQLRLCQLGTKDVLAEETFAARLVTFALPRVCFGPRAACLLHHNRLRSAALSIIASSCESEPTKETFTLASQLIEAASIDDDTLAAYATGAAYRSVDGAADMMTTTNAHNRLERIVCGAANAAIYADQAERLRCCNSSQSADKLANAALDQSLAAYVEAIVAILRAMSAPGCRWLDLLKALP